MDGPSTSTRLPPTAGIPGPEIFQKLPNYTLFNKKFEDANDAFFLDLHEVDPKYLNEESQKKLFALISFTPLDPRNRKESTQELIDHSKPKSPTIFNAEKMSKLTRDEHTTLLQLYKTWQNGGQGDAHQMELFCSKSQSLKEEREEWHKFVAEYEDAYRLVMCASTKRFKELYCQWYEQFVELFLERHQDMKLRTFSGLPLVRFYKGDITGDGETEISDVQMLNEPQVIFPLLEREEDVRQLRVLNARMSTYVQYAKESMKNTQELLGQVKRKQFPTSEDGRHQVVLPLETLLFLLMVGERADLPTECFMEIRQGNNEKCKLFKFGEPLPSRNTGWYTHSKLIEEVYTAFQIVNCHSNKEKHNPEEIDASFTPQEEAGSIYEDNLRKWCETTSNDSHTNTNVCATKWSLIDTSNSQVPFDIITTFLPFFTQASNGNQLELRNIKLEYKPKFGCEMHSKYELLKAWFLLRFSATVTSSICCLRLAAEDCEFQAYEHMDMAKVDRLLLECYKVKATQLIRQLHQFFALLPDFPEDTYFLRLKPSTQDKLYMYKETADVTPLTIFLHDLVRSGPLDLETNLHPPPILGITEEVCSEMHSHYNVIPCAFRPKEGPISPEKKSPRRKRKKEQRGFVSNDRQLILETVSQAKDKKQQIIKAQKQKTKRAKNSLRRARRAAAKANELQQQEETDRVMFAF